jgi:hypothetical protein
MKTHDLLLTELLPVTSGFNSTLQNVGSTKNTGYEVSFTTVNLQNWRGLTWTSDFNWSTNKNQILALASGATSDAGNGWFVGSPININSDPNRPLFYDYKYDGVWQYADSVAMKGFNATGSTFKPGYPRVADVNKDGKIDANDRTIIGDSYPGWTGSMSNRITYHNFDLSALVTAKWNYMFVDDTPRSYFGRYGNIADMDYRTPTNPANRTRLRPPAPWTVNMRRRACATGRTGASATSRRAAEPARRAAAQSAQPALLLHGAGSVRPHRLRRHRPELAAPCRRCARFLGTNIVW